MDLNECVKCDLPDGCEASHLESDSFETISIRSEYTCTSVDGSAKDVCKKYDTKRYRVDYIISSMIPFLLAQNSKLIDLYYGQLREDPDFTQERQPIVLRSPNSANAIYLHMVIGLRGGLTFMQITFKLCVHLLCLASDEYHSVHLLQIEYSRLPLRLGSG